MKATFSTTMISGQPQLPPFESEDGYQLWYNYVDGIPQSGGYSIIGPSNQDTVIVEVDVSLEVFELMKEDPNLLWIEEL